MNSGRISTKELRRWRITPDSTSVDGMPRDGAESGHVGPGELLGRGDTHARDSPPTNMTCFDAKFKIFSRWETEGRRNHIRSGPFRFAGFEYKYFKYPAPRPQVELKRGERMDSLE